MRDRKKKSINRIRSNIDHHVTVTFFNIYLPTLNHHIMDHNARIQSALDDLNSQKKPNITATAKNEEIARITLSDRFYDKSTII